MIHCRLALYIDSVYNANVEICDIKIYEGILEKYYAPSENPKPYKLSKKGLPTGAKDFDARLVESSNVKDFVFAGNKIIGEKR